MKIRTSVGTAAFLGLRKLKVDAEYSTAYLMTPLPCLGRCKYCPQGVGKGEELGRVKWPLYDLEEVVFRLKKNPPRRICVQTQLNPYLLRYLEKVLPKISEIAPVSVSFYPIKEEEIWRLKELGAERIGIPFDAASPRVMRIVGRENEYVSWEKTRKMIDIALQVFEEWKVSTHLIIGMGETDEEALLLAKEMYKKKVITSIFPFYPIKGTPMESFNRPDLGRYRAIQMWIYAIYQGEEIPGDLFAKGKLKALPKLKDRRAFAVFGCPGCNRPYYTEDPSLPYNFPSPPVDPSRMIEEARKYVESDSRREERRNN